MKKGVGEMCGKWGLGYVMVIVNHSRTVDCEIVAMGDVTSCSLGLLGVCWNVREALLGESRGSFIGRGKAGHNEYGGVGKLGGKEGLTWG